MKQLFGSLPLNRGVEGRSDSVIDFQFSKHWTPCASAEHQAGYEDAEAGQAMDRHFRLPCNNMVQCVVTGVDYPSGLRRPSTGVPA